MQIISYNFIIQVDLHISKLLMQKVIFFFLGGGGGRQSVRFQIFDGLLECGGMNWCSLLSHPV